MRNFKHKLLWLMLIPICISTYGQSNSDYFYYYKGEKLSLNLDKSRIAISFDGEISEAEMKALFLDSKWESIYKFHKDHTRQTVLSVSQQSIDRKNIQTFYCEILSNSRNQEEYTEKITALKKMQGNFIVSPCFITNESNQIGLTGNFYVRLKNKVDLTLLNEMASRHAIEILGHSGYDELLYVLTCDKNANFDPMQSANLFYESGLFEYCEPAFSMYFKQYTADPFYNSQWLLNNTGQNGGTSGVDISAELAWNVTRGDPGIWTAVIDDGFETNHPDLVNNVSHSGWDGTSNTGPAIVYANHGTACAGIVSAEADNNIGISGVANLARIYPVSMNFPGGVMPMDIHNAFYTVAQNIGAHVISCSWGGGSQSNVVDGAITYALTVPRNGKGIVVVFSMGNNNNSNGEYPANSNPDILAVGGIDRCGFRSGHNGVTVGSCDPWLPNWSPGSSFGNRLDVVAGGSVIHSTDRQGGNGYDPSDYTSGFGGTSAACPAVAGVAALMMSVHPDMTRQDVNYFICLTAKKLTHYWFQPDPGHPISTWNNETGYGLVDAHQAVLFAMEVACNSNPNIAITSNVNAPLDKIKSAANTINASSLVNNGARAIYRAGDEVRLSVGFGAVSGSTFRAYIQSCPGGFQLKQANILDNYAENLDEGNMNIKKEKASEIKIVPNPSNGYFKLLFADNDQFPSRIIITDLLGKVVREFTILDSKDVSFDLSASPAGIYIVKANYNGTITSTKIIKN